MELVKVIIKMGKENLTFGDIEIGRDKFYRYKNPIFLEKKKYRKRISI